MTYTFSVIDICEDYVLVIRTDKVGNSVGEPIRIRR